MYVHGFVKPLATTLHEETGSTYRKKTMFLTVVVGSTSKEGSFDIFFNLRKTNESLNIFFGIVTELSCIFL